MQEEKIKPEGGKGMRTQLQRGGAEAVAGIDPSRYSFHLYALSHNQEYFTAEVGKIPAVVREVVERLKREGIEDVVIEGAGLAGGAVLYELEEAGFQLWEISPYSNSRISSAFSEAHSDSSDARAAAVSGLYFRQLLAPLRRLRGRLRLYKLVSCWEQLTKERARLINRTHALLADSWGGAYKQVRGSKSLRRKRGREFFLQYPSLNRAVEAGVIEGTGKWSGREYIEEVEALVRLHLGLVEEIEVRRKEVERRIKEVVEADEEGKVLMEVKGIGYVTAAKLLAYVRDIGRFARESQFAAYSGLAPRRWQSGQRSRQQRRSRYSRKLRAVMFAIAFSAMRVDEKARAYYLRKRQEGKSHREAVLRLARHYARLIYRVWKRGAYYELQQ